MFCEICDLFFSWRTWMSWLQIMAALPMKPGKVGVEEATETIHRIRITLSSKNVKNLEKGAWLSLDNVDVFGFDFCDLASDGWAEILITFPWCSTPLRSWSRARKRCPKQPIWVLWMCMCSLCWSHSRCQGQEVESQRTSPHAHKGLASHHEKISLRRRSVSASTAYFPPL